jgi:hypothetical protein
MPEYDATNYPKPMTDDLTDGEVGRDSGLIRSTWPSSNVLPERYAGPPPSREFETAHLGANVVSRPPAVPPATSDASSVETSIVPPPGHTAQP